ncbi:hypothetical protein AMJ39_06195 [candidate division TA06 bacterium DG_24]|uniref:Lipopolysaccharide heptosyltransferase II n=1 Tax=candidate division TA06 bacterium DG_24 TaxID=1703770 RepID=A0A0S7WS66_UNCT6|nr:MAG: hypothetical protein AMJ39_06195 [candidate division TA06 bacterium DG_24]
MKRKDPRKILIIRFGSLGDVVLVTPFIDAVRSRYPESSVALAVKGEYEDLFAADSRIDRLFSLGGRTSSGRGAGMYYLLWQVRREGFDAAVDLQRNPRSILLSALCGARSRAGVRTERAGRRRLVQRKVRAELPHVVDRYRAALPQLAEVATDRRPRLVIGDGVRQRADELLAKGGVSEEDMLVGVAPGAGRATKRWPATKFAELGRLLVERANAGVVLVGDSDERGLADEVASAVGGRAIVTAGRTTVGELAAVLARCRVLVTNDSGPMHVATGVGTPVVAIFGATTPELGFAPLGERDIIVSRSLECRPCSLHGSERCPVGTFECMEGIEAQEVFEKTLSLIGSTYEPARLPEMSACRPH